MKKTKKILSLCLCTSLFTLSVLTPAFAADKLYAESYEMAISVENSQMNDGELIQLMKRYGYSSSEIDTILKLEHDRIESINNVSPCTFPSSPKIGDIHAETYRIHFDTAVTGAAGIAALLVGNGLAAGVAIVVAQAIWTEYQHNIDATGVSVKVYYTYGYTNDGVLGWTPGQTQYSFIYD